MTPQQTQHPKRWSHRKILLIALVATSVLIVTAALAWLGLRTHGGVTTQYQASSVNVNGPVEIHFNQGLLHFDTSKITMTPEIEGQWQVRSSLAGGDTLEFAHTQPLKTGTTYTVNFGEVDRVSGMTANIAPITFTTELAPGIERASFGEGQLLAADAAFEVTLSQQNRGLRDLTIVTKPAMTLERTSSDDASFTWKAKKLLPQGKKVSVRLIDKLSQETLLERTVRIAAEPAVKDGVKAHYFGASDVATIRFSQPIDQKSGEVKFDVDGAGSWTDKATYQFKPTSVAAGRTYSYTIPKGLRSTQGGIVAKAHTYHFSTPGAVRVVAMSPYGQELSSARQTIRFTFDQPVNKASAQERAHVSHGKVTGVSWEGNTLALTVVNLGKQNTVRGWVDSGVKPVFGLVSVASFGLSFTTEVPTKHLNVPMYYQQFSQSCEAASVRMALSSKGVNGLSDWAILQQFGYDPRPLKNGVWDDPQLQFVGDVRGSQGAGTGWGVYAEPVAKAVRHYGRGAAVQYGVSRGFVASQIHAGNPVVLWGIWNESATQKTWKTPAGRKVSGPIPMHVRLVVGVKGNSSNPLGFYVNDPITGPTYWTADYLEYNAARAGGANQAVAIQ